MYQAGNRLAGAAPPAGLLSPLRAEYQGCEPKTEALLANPSWPRKDEDLG
jgi:hypothetical protein